MKTKLFYYVVFIFDDAQQTQTFYNITKALKYYNKIKDQAPEIRKVDEITGEFITIKI